MKFGDKLIALRKKKGMSQEDLAEKLNVSRQSVSKWESNNTYPETDKIVQICSIFDCSMDDLINDKITDISKVERTTKKKENIIDSFLGFITKTVNLFASMKFIDVIKCLIEIIIICLILISFDALIINLLTAIIVNFFHFLPHHIYTIIYNIIWSLLCLVCFIISLIIIIHIFKIRYLDYFDLKDKILPENIPNVGEEKNAKDMTFKPKIIIRDPNHEPFAFLTILSKFILNICKFLAFWLILGLIALLFASAVTLVVAIPLAIYSSIIAGIALTIFSICGFTVVLIYLLLFFCLNKKINLKFTFLVSIILFLIAIFGTGSAIISLKDYKIINKNNYIEKAQYQEKILYKDKLFFDLSYDTKYLIDDTINNDEIIVSFDYDKAINKIYLYNTEYYQMPNIEIHRHSSSTINLKKVYNQFINDLKNKTIRNYPNQDIENITITANTTTINKLLANLEKVYLYNKIPLANGYKIEIIDYKVFIDDYNCSINYDIYNDLITSNNACSCEKITTNTINGEKLQYNCQPKTSLN